MICCCQMAGTKACDTCPNAPSRIIPLEIFHDFNSYISKSKKIIEKFDEKGNLIERITEAL